MTNISNVYHCKINLFYFAGFLIDFISGPVSVGFTSAAAIIIATTQIKDVLGLSFPGSKFLDVWEQLFEHISETRLWDTLLGFICMAILLLLRVNTQYYVIKHKRHLQNAKICYAFFRTRFCSSDRRQYSGSPFWDLRVTSPIIKEGGWGRGPECYGVVRGSRVAVCANGHSTKMYVKSTLTSQWSEKRLERYPRSLYQCGHSCMYFMCYWFW